MMAAICFVSNELIPFSFSKLRYLPGGNRVFRPAFGLCQPVPEPLVAAHPRARVDPAALTRLEDLLKAMGAKVNRMEPAHHDQVLAVVSHTPHLIAYTMVGVARGRALKRMSSSSS